MWVMGSPLRQHYGRCHGRAEDEQRADELEPDREPAVGADEGPPAARRSVQEGVMPRTELGLQPESPDRHKALQAEPFLLSSELQPQHLFAI